MHVDLKDFLRSGRLGPVTLGASRRELEAALGPPEQWGPEGEAGTCEIWQYGGLDVEPWIVGGELRLSQAEAALRREGWGYARVIPMAIPAVDLVLPSGVVMRFHEQEAGADPVLGGIWHGSPEAAPRG